MNLKTKKRTQTVLFVILGVLVLVVAIVLLNKSLTSDKNGKSESAYAEPSGDGLTILKDELTTKPKFFTYEIGDTKMEIIALKAADGSIRTAFNTCQVCYGSGKGYYKAEGSTLVCQNCGNTFSADQVALQKGGCNPIPIGEENKTEDSTQITISNDYLDEMKGAFVNWKS